MEAPEKLYFDERDRGILDIYSNKESNDDIEYIRTDVFIEKAVSYIQQHWIWNTNIIEDFINYMKGE